MPKLGCCFFGEFLSVVEVSRVQERLSEAQDCPREGQFWDMLRDKIVVADRL